MEFDQEAARREKVRLLRQDRVDRYDRNVPIWWGSLRDMFEDEVWEGALLDRYCQKWFRKSEPEMRLLLGLSDVFTEQKKAVAAEIEASIPERKKVIKALIKETGKALTPAERAKAYRERKKSYPGGAIGQ